MFLPYFLFTLFISPSLSRLLVDFDAAAGDDPSMTGLINLEAARSVKQNSNSPDLFIDLGVDPKGVPAAHFHRAVGNIRSEYHALNQKGEADMTYYIGYSFSLSQLQKSLMIWQFKEFVANAADGANIPLALEINSAGKLEFQYQSSFPAGKRVAQWTKTIAVNTQYHVGIVINTSTPGWVELYFDGKKQRLGTTNVFQLPATTFPGRAEPKFGAYRGEEVEINTFVYRVQIGTSIGDIKEAAGFAPDGYEHQLGIMP